MQALSLETLADPAKARCGLAARCWRCSRWHDFDIAELVARHGNRSVKAFQPRRPSRQGRLANIWRRGITNLTAAQVGYNRRRFYRYLGNAG